MRRSKTGATSIQVASDGERIELERRAELTRARLVDTLVQLERRRHEWFNVGAQLHRHTRGMVVYGGVGLGSIGLLGGLVFFRSRVRRRQRRKERVRAIARFWRHPDWLAQKKKSGFLTSLMSIGASVVAVAVIQLAGRIMGLRRTPSSSFSAVGSSALPRPVFARSEGAIPPLQMPPPR